MVDILKADSESRCPHQATSCSIGVASVLFRYSGLTANLNFQRTSHGFPIATHLFPVAHPANRIAASIGLRPLCCLWYAWLPLLALTHLHAILFQFLWQIRWTYTALLITRHGIVNEPWIGQLQVGHNVPEFFQAFIFA